jgi:hypothetical protein
MMRWGALAAAALLCGCVLTSERPLYRAAQGARVFADGASFAWRENGDSSDTRIITIRLRNGRYDIEVVGEDRPMRGAVFVPVRATREADFIIQLYVSSEIEQPVYAFMWATADGYRVVAAPSEIDETPAGEAALAAACVARPNGECRLDSARALERIYRAGVYPRYVTGAETPDDYIDLAPVTEAEKDARP